MAEIAYIALGSNKGDREHYLAAARAAIAELAGSRIIAASGVEETEPVGPPGQGRYLNQMLAVETGLDPETLLSELHRIESENGRERGLRWGERTLDLDIVRFGDRRIATDDLVVPHPELPNRDFWQRELAQMRVE
ncbi:MAG TPA: 2-amino-4-hydroxy-6-hydroxymethyldihydropteridine diphosphokinase [Gemmatimonadaceae bacterium]|nr:2-amino-4-hydroxy-6-hydroxymethyldihydropteridine diphosphokinase [Gemmatimonadaceae bacterium]